jgi:hypothetical protein
MLGLVVVMVLMAGIICVALVQTRSAYTASFGSLLDASDLRSPQPGACCPCRAPAAAFELPASP